MIRSSEELWFNGHSSYEFGIVNVNIGDGMLEEVFLAPKSIRKEKIKHRDKPYFYGVDEEVKTFELTLALTDEALENARFDKTHLRNIAIWLRGESDGYKELWFSEDCEKDEYGDYDITKPKRIYFAMMSGSSSCHHFSLEEGYIKITMECNSPYCYSPIKGNNKYLVGIDEDGNLQDAIDVRISFFNHGDLQIKPEISIINKTPNQPIKIGFESISNELQQLDKDSDTDTFKRTINIPRTDYSKFSTFELSEGKKASGSFELIGNDATVYNSEWFDLGNKRYEFNLGDGIPYNKNDTDNILVPVTGKKASNTLKFDENSFVKDSSTVMIGDLQFEFDWNNIVSPVSEKVDISNCVEHAKTILHLNSNPIDSDEMKLGDTNYTFIGSTNEDMLKITDHLLTNGTDINVMVRTDRKTLTQDKVNINQKVAHNIKDCLIRNISKNPSDLGIRKVKYINKDFLMTLWDSESDEDFDEEIDGVGINTSLCITFDEPLNTETINENTIKITNEDGVKIPAKFSVNTNDPKILYVAPQSSYEYDSNYFLYISKGVKDIKNNSYKQVRKIKFHTKKKDEVDDNNYNNVSSVKVFNIYSAQKIDKSTVTTSNVYVKDDSNNNIEVNINIINEGRTINISPKTRYENGKSYNLTISTNVKDIEGNSLSPIDKVIKFTVQNNVNSAFIDEDCTEVLIDRKINEPIIIPLTKEIMSNSISNSVGLYDKNNNKIDTYLDVDSSNKNLLKVSFAKSLDYNSIYYLYISNIIKFTDGTYLDAPRKYKIVTETEESAKGINNNSNNNTTAFESGDKNKIQQDYKLVNTDKAFSISLPNPVDSSTVNNNVYVLDSKKNKVDCNIDINLTNLKIFPKPVWKAEEQYTVWVTKDLKSSNKPRVFAGDVPVDANKNKGDYENALEIFGKLGFDVIKTNGFKYQNNKILDVNGDEVIFSPKDILIGQNYGLKDTDYNEDKTLKDGTTLVNIPTVLFVKDIHRIAKDDRVQTKKAMEEYAEEIKNTTWTTGSMYNEDKAVITFTTKSRNEHITVDIDDSILLSNNSILIKEVPKKIKGMKAGDDILFYENIPDIDFMVDDQFLIKQKVPLEAKAYATRDVTSTVASTNDDFTNAQILKSIGYEIVDITDYTLDEKKKIVFKDGDLVIGGEFAGTKNSDYDKYGNLKTTPPQTDDKDDKRKERCTGIPNLNIYPAKRLQGSSEDPGRSGTKKAIEDFVNLTKQATVGKTVNTGVQDNIAPNGITLKYRVPKGTNVYGTGTDLFNGQRYLTDFSYTFINVGTMTLEEKKSLPFKKGDIVVGGISALDTLKESGTEKTVTGIPAIDIKGALRLGGKDRYETEELIKNFAAGLKVSGIEIGDVLKFKIVTSDKANSAPSQSNSNNTDDINSNKEKKNERIEYHQIKSLKELSRGRLFVEFSEDIRAVSYIKEIEVENLYRLYDQRKAEDYLFDAPYQIRIGENLLQTLKHTIKAINGTGEAGIEYSLRTFKHKVVLAQKLNDNEIQIQAIEPGQNGNIPCNMASHFDSLNRFLTPTLTNGRDCTSTDAIKCLAKAIEEVSKRPNRRNKDRYTFSYTGNELTVTHILCGKKYNNIVCVSNVFMEQKNPYLILESADLVDLKDFLTREKSVAKWNSACFQNGEDPSAEACILALKKAIESHQSDEIVVDYLKNEDGADNLRGFKLEYKVEGEKGNIPINSSCSWGKLSGKKLKNGLYGLDVDEEIIISTENKEITSSKGKDRYKNFNNCWINIPLNGICFVNKNPKSVYEIRFRYREKFLI